MTWSRTPYLARVDAIADWLDGYPQDGKTWARPCPMCGSFVTDPYAHCERMHRDDPEALVPVEVV